MGHDAHHQQRAEAVPGLESDPEAPQDQQRKNQHHQCGSDEPQLLAHHGKNEVVMLLGQVQKLLPPLAQAHARESTAANGNEALAHLIALVQGVDPRVLPHADAVRAVGDDPGLHQLHIGKAQRSHAADAADGPALIDAAHDHQHNACAHDQNSTGQVWLQQHQARKKCQCQEVRPDAVFEAFHEVFLFGNAVGKVHDDGQLRDFRGLERQHLPQPPGGAVFLDAHTGHQHQDQQEDGHIHQYLCHAPQAMIVHAAHNDHGGYAQQGKYGLPL